MNPSIAAASITAINIAKEAEDLRENIDSIQIESEKD